MNKPMSVGRGYLRDGYTTLEAGRQGGGGAPAAKKGGIDDVYETSRGRARRCGTTHNIEA